MDDIADNQRMLAREIRASREQADSIYQSISSSLQNLEQSAMASAYYNKITAQNASFLATVAYYNN